MEETLGDFEWRIVFFNETTPLIGASMHAVFSSQTPLRAASRWLVCTGSVSFESLFLTYKTSKKQNKTKHPKQNQTRKTNNDIW